MSDEAKRMFRELTKDAPKDKNCLPTLQARREAEEQVRAALLSFPAESETSLEQDERDYLLIGDRPLLSRDPRQAAALVLNEIYSRMRSDLPAL
jgi:hypothetical protein